MTFTKVKSLVLYVVILGCILILGCEEKESMATIEVSYYKEPHRPQYHFSPEANWMNDPNGMVFYDGEYHLFYQYYPDSTVWGPMHWGHAVSPDMVRWEHLPIALYPDSLGYIFSGSAVIDYDNTSGLGSSDNPPMVAVFTHHDTAGERANTKTYQVQSIAYSLDKGRTFTKYHGNPVVTNPGIKDFRDPKVIWHEESRRWVMMFAAYDKAMIYTSPDLKEWTYASEFGIEGDRRLWECPDIFPIQVEGSEEEKWILITSIQKEGPNGGTATSYFIGDFDGTRFIGAPSDQRWMDYGTDNYAMVTWSKDRSDDQRVLALGWMSNWQYAQRVPTHPWRSAMTLPRVLTLHKTSDENYELRSNPVEELEALEVNTRQFKSTKDQSAQIILVDTNDVYTYRIGFQLDKPITETFTLRLSNRIGEYIDLGYDPRADQYFLDRTHAGKSDFSDLFAARHTAPALSKSRRVNVEVYIDHSSIELFLDDGRVVMTDIYFPSEPLSKIELIGNSSEYFGRSSYGELQSIW